MTRKAKSDKFLFQRLHRIALGVKKHPPAHLANLISRRGLVRVQLPRGHLAALAVYDVKDLPFVALAPRRDIPKPPVSPAVKCFRTQH